MVLEKIGLTGNQASVYLSLLKLGSTTAHNIIKESGLHRSRVYDSLEKLEELGLVTFIVKDFKKYFQAVSPEKMLHYIEEQREFLKQALPQLKKLEGTKKEEINASIYKGKEGIKAILSIVLKEKQDFYIMGAKGLIFRELKYFMPNFEKERVKKKIRFIRLFDNEERAKITIKDLFAKGKILPIKFGESSVVWIFGSKLVILLWKQDYPTAFLINQKEIADSFRNWFMMTYKGIKT